LHRQVTGLRALEDAINVAGRALVLVDLSGPVGGEATVRRVVAERIDVRQAEPRSPAELTREEWIAKYSPTPEVIPASPTTIISEARS
jgi:hypothetical protein